MTNIFQYKSQLEKLTHRMSQLYSFATSYNREINNELFEETVSITNKLYITYASKDERALNELEERTKKEDLGKYIDIESIKKYKDKKYSKFNCYIALRRYCEKFREENRFLSSLKSEVRSLLHELKMIKKGLENENIDNETLMNKIETARQSLTFLLGLEILPFDGLTLFQSLFLNGNTISKHELCNIIVLDKSKRTKDYIDSLPDRLNFRLFSEAIFAHRIEDEEYEWIFSMFLEEFLKEMDENDELRASMRQTTNEILNGIPTYNVTFDEFGEIDEIKQNKPSLSLVKNS